MHRSHLLRWLALAVAVCSFQCLEDLSENCQKTRTCAPAPQLGSDCVWRYPDGRIWEGAPHKTPEGLWVWPNGKKTETQTLDCVSTDAGVFADAGLGSDAVDNCPEIPCDEPLLCDEPSRRCVRCKDDQGCAGTSDPNRGPTPVCDARIHDCVPCRDDSNCAAGLHCKPDANPANNRCVACTAKSHCSGDDICDLSSNQCTSTCTGPGQCKEPKPVCSVATGLCVDCIGDGDCSGATAHCNTARKECVQCVDSTGCSNPLAPACSAGNRCVECADDSNCRNENAPHCDVVTNLCVACLSSSECTARGNSRCNALHQCVPCTDNGQCEADAPFCDIAGGGRCVACVDDTTCSPGLVCDPLSGNCVGCVDNADCNRDPGAARCNVGTHSCVGCQNSRECTDKFGPREICSNESCVQCTGNGDCQADPNKSRCDSGGLCASCRGPADCSAVVGKHACTGGNNGRCVECLGNADCVGNPNGLACNTTTNTCVACVADIDCKTPGASRCVANQCVACVNDPASGSTPANSHCGHIVSGGRTRAVCDTSAGASAGVCVECTGTQRAACGANVCNSLTKICSPFPVGSAGLCEDCVSDAHCALTQRCVQETFGATPLGFSCFPLAQAGDCPQTPFAGLTTLATIDSPSQQLCLLRRTTCAGFNQANNKPCTLNADCGEANQDDGRCDLGTGVCSLPCTSGVDCPSGDNASCLGGICQL